ncbi:MAG TPA: XRE family transcriptional regulator, partial [Geobacteraceae bacterium]
IKWLLPGGNDRQAISYTARAGTAGAPHGTASFAGTLVSRSDGSASSSAIAGDTSITVADRHWADANGDGRIDDNEIMPAYYLCEEMKGLGLDWKTIEAIWSGKGYRWGGVGKGFQVQR